MGPLFAHTMKDTKTMWRLSKNNDHSNVHSHNFKKPTRVATLDTFPPTIETKKSLKFSKTSFIDSKTYFSKKNPTFRYFAILYKTVQKWNAAKIVTKFWRSSIMRFFQNNCFLKFSKTFKTITLAGEVNI